MGSQTQRLKKIKGGLGNNKPHLESQVDRADKGETDAEVEGSSLYNWVNFTYHLKQPLEEDDMTRVWQ